MSRSVLFLVAILTVVFGAQRKFVHLGGLVKHLFSNGESASEVLVLLDKS